jgi:hypothetical protein
MRIVVVAVILSFCSAACATTSQHEVFNNALPFKSEILGGVKGLDQDKATLDNPEAARQLIMAIRTIQKGPAGLPDTDGTHPNSYVVIHLLSWAKADKLKVQADHWYLYRDVPVGKWSQEDFTSMKRLLGVTRAYFLYVHMNDVKGKVAHSNGATYVPSYDLTLAKKTPANLAHLYALLQAYTGGVSANSTPIGGALFAEEIEPYSVWGGGILNIQYRPCDILIKSTFHVKPDDQDQKLADDITFDNEGPYWWDVGFALPVKKISELKLDSTSGTATPAKVNGQNVFAVLDGYIRPVDVKGSAFTAIPHPIAGVAFAKQPLSKILVGGAWGPKASEIYLGAMFVKQPILSGNGSCGNPSGTSLTGKSHYCTQFTIGINLSVSAIASKLGAPK